MRTKAPVVSGLVDSSSVHFSPVWWPVWWVGLHVEGDALCDFLRPRVAFISGNFALCAASSFVFWENLKVNCDGPGSIGYFPSSLYTYTIGLYGISRTLRRAQLTIHKNPNRRVIIRNFFNTAWPRNIAPLVYPHRFYTLVIGITAVKLRFDAVSPQNELKYKGGGYISRGYSIIPPEYDTSSHRECCAATMNNKPTVTVHVGTAECGSMNFKFAFHSVRHKIHRPLTQLVGLYHSVTSCR